MYFRMAVILVITLYTARIIFNALGVKDYGIYNVVGSIIILFSFINSGLSNATKRYITAEIASGDDESRRIIFNSAIIAHIFISIIIFVIAETVGLWMVNEFLNLPEERMFAANIAFQLSVATAIVNIMQSPFISAILAYEKMSIYAYLTIVDVTCKLLIAFLIQVMSGDKLIFYSTFIFLIGVINVIVYKLYCNHCFPMCRWLLVREKHILKKMFNYTSWSLIGQGAAVLSNQGVNFILNLFCGVVVNAAMGISNQITKVVNDFVINFQYAFNPQITKLYVSDNIEDLKKLVWRSSRYSSFLVLLFLLPVCFEAADFLLLWLGDYPEYSVEFCVLTMICVYLEAITAPLWMVLCSDTNIKVYQLTVSTIFLLNVFLSWIFMVLGQPPFTVMAVRIFVDVVLILTRLLFVKNKIEGFCVWGWIKDVFGNSVLIIIVPLLCTFVLSDLHYPNTIVRFLIIGLISMLITLFSIIVIGLTKNEKAFLIKNAKEKLRLI